MNLPSNFKGRLRKIGNNSISKSCYIEKKNNYNLIECQFKFFGKNAK